MSVAIIFDPEVLKGFWWDCQKESRQIVIDEVGSYIIATSFINSISMIASFIAIFSKTSCYKFSFLALRLIYHLL